MNRIVVLCGAVAAVLLTVWWMWDTRSAAEGGPTVLDAVGANITAADERGALLHQGDANPRAVVSLQPEAATDDAPAALAPAADLGESVRWTGTVTDPDGVPLAGVDAWILPSGPTLQAAGYALALTGPPQGMTFATVHAFDDVPLAELPHARTDAEGRFAIDGHHVHQRLVTDQAYLAPRSPVLLLAAPGLTTRVVPCTAPAGAQDEVGRFILEPEALLEGRVVDADGRPLEDAVVQVENANPRPQRAANVRTFMSDTHAELQSTHTDSAGQFRMAGLWCGTVDVKVSLPGCIPVRQQFDLDAPGSTRVDDIVLQRGRCVSGVVLDARGRPLPGAEVLASAHPVKYSGDGCIITTIPEDADRIPLERQVAARYPAGRTLTDAEGRFLLDGLDGVNFSLYVQAPGHEVARVADVPADTNSLSIPLEREATLHVKLVDGSSGAVLPGPQGEAMRIGGEHVEPVALVTEPGDDVLVVHGVGPYATQLVVWAPGYARRTITGPGVFAVGGHGEFTVKLEPEAALEGRVLSTSGEPLSGAEIELAIHAGNIWPPLPPARSDADGRFRFGNLQGGEVYDLSAFKPGHAGARLDEVATAAGETVTGLELIAPRGASVEGTVYLASGLEAMFVQFYLARTDLDAPRLDGRTTGRIGWVMTGESGRYAFRDLPPGRYELRPKHFPPISLELAEGQHEVLDLHKRPEPVVSGRVLVGGRPMAGVLVSAQPEAALRLAPRDAVATDERGDYRIALACAGTFTVQVLRMNRYGRAGDPVPGGVEVSLGWGQEQVVDLTAPGCRIAGSTVDAQGGLARPGVEVLLHRWLAEEDEWDLMQGETSGAAGNFAFESLEPGTYFLSTDSYAYAWQHIEVEHGPLELSEGADLDVTLEIDRGAVLSGEVRTAAGVLVPDGFSVEVHDEGAEGGRYLSQVDDGRYVVAGLPPGTYRIVATDESLRYGEPLQGGTVIALREREQRRLDLTAE